MKLVVAFVAVLLVDTALGDLSRMRQSTVEVQGGVPRVVRRTGTMRGARTGSRGSYLEKFNGPDETKLIWHQHEDTAIYDSVAISTMGYIAAATFLNPPEMVEVYTVTGEHGQRPMSR